MGGTLPNWCMTFNDPITLSAVISPVLAASSTATGTIDISIPFIRTELRGDWSQFTGRVNATTTSVTEGEFRINHLFDMPMAAITLGNKESANHLIPVPPEGLGFSIGEVAGAAGSFLKDMPPTNAAGRVFAYAVGAKDSESSFAGIITDQAVTGPVSILSQNGFDYQLQYRPDLVSGGWRNLGTPVSGNGVVITLSQPVVAEAKKGFYRITISP